VTKGKPWTAQEEKRLLELRSEGKLVADIAGLMGKSEQAIMKKLQRLGLKVVQLRESNGTTTSEIDLPVELPSVEESLKVFAGAMKALEAPGLPKTEVLRLRSLIQAASVYQAKIGEYMDYRGIEKRLVELNKKYEEWVKQRNIVQKGEPVEVKLERNEYAAENEHMDKT
jgi:hypothetical protein